MKVTLHAYDDWDLINPTPDIAGALANARGLTWTSEIHGGPKSLNCVVTVPHPEAWDIEVGKILVARHGAEMLWHGRLEDLEYEQTGEEEYNVSLRAFGLWSRMKSIKSSRLYTTATTGKTIVQDALADLGEASSDYSLIVDPLRNLNSVSYVGKSLAEVVEDVCLCGDTASPPIPLMFAFVGTRTWSTDATRPMGRLWKRNTDNNPDWLIRLQDLGRRWAYSISGIYNYNIAVIYNDGANVTSAVSDTDSIAAYGRRTPDPLPSVQSNTLSVAEAVRSAFLATYKVPRPRLIPFTLRGQVANNGGVNQPVCMVQAGDTMRIIDWVGGYTFMVGAVTYHRHDTDPMQDTISITPEERPVLLSAQA